MIILLSLLGLSARATAQPRDSLVIAFWNVENFFDYRSDNKPQYWTRRRFYRKCDAIAKTLLRMADRYGRMPDAVGFAEVENAFVMRQLCSATALRKLDYALVHYESPDHRGIDCALLCRRSTLPLLRCAPKHVLDSAGGILATRDILLAEFDSLAILVNHHPSQLGGKDGPRRSARTRLRELTDSLHAAGVRRTLAIGDFNEDLWAEIRRSEPADDGKGGGTVTGGGAGKGGGAVKGGGTIKYNGGWEKIDGGFAEGFSRIREEVFADPLLLVPDAAFGGKKPRRTFVGPRYTGGVSDHLPIVFVLYY